MFRFFSGLLSSSILAFMCLADLALLYALVGWCLTQQTVYKIVPRIVVAFFALFFLVLLNTTVSRLRKMPKELQTTNSIFPGAKPARIARWLSKMQFWRYIITFPLTCFIILWIREIFDLKATGYKAPDPFDFEIDITRLTGLVHNPH